MGAGCGPNLDPQLSESRSFLAEEETDFLFACFLGWLCAFFNSLLSVLLAALTFRWSKLCNDVDVFEKRWYLL